MNGDWGREVVGPSHYFLSMTTDAADGLHVAYQSRYGRLDYAYRCPPRDE